MILVRGIARKFHRGRGWAVPGYQFRKMHERAVAAIVVFRETVLCIFPRCRFFRSSPMAESVQQAKIGEVGLGSRTTLLLYLLYKQAHIYAARTGK